MGQTMHVMPVDGLIEHDNSTATGPDCACGPTCEPVPDEAGGYGWLYLHHSLDGRELDEPDRGA